MMEKTRNNRPPTPRIWIPACAGMRKAGLALGGVMLLALLAAQAAQAQTYSVIFSFSTGPEGTGPTAGLIGDSVGNLYGTTQLGGSSSCGGVGCGVVFELDSSGNETVLHRFTGGSDGSEPYGPLLRDAVGNLYGTTQTGGTGSCNVFQGFPGCGIVFKVDTTGKETVLYTFTGGSDGGFPKAGLIEDAAGNLYGTTSGGGDLTEVCAGGGNPTPYGCGVVFRLDPAGNETVLHAFTAGTDGVGPAAGLTRDPEGNLYGTTVAGGGTGCNGSGCGVVFKLSLARKEETILHSFSGSDGDAPYYGYLVRDAAGNLYGTTLAGGNGTLCGTPLGCGVVFKLDTTGNETLLYTFTGGSDGSVPDGGVVRDTAGNLYATATEGGVQSGSNGHGTIVQISPTGKARILYTFSGGADGGLPTGELLPYEGYLYGVAGSGGGGAGGCLCGVAFKLSLH